MGETVDLFEKHRATLERAALACRERHCWSPFPEMPAKYPDSAAAQAAGLAAFHGHLDRRFALDQPGSIGEAGEEISPYTQAAARHPLSARRSGSAVRRRDCRDRHLGRGGCVGTAWAC